MKQINSILLLLLAFFNNSFCQTSGDLDLTFGGTGKVFTKFDNSFFPFNRSQSLTTDNTRIYVVGESLNELENRIEISCAVYLYNGELDSTFNSDGKITFPFNANGTDIKVSSSGQIFISGFDNENFIIMKLNSDGSSDTSWGNNGTSIINVTNEYDRPTRLAIKSDGKIVAAGYSGTGINDISIVQLSINGQLDLSFGTQGVFTMDLQGFADRIKGLTIQPDNKILVSGTSKNSDNSTDGFTLRLNENGLLDSSFNNSGYYIYDFENTQSFGGITLQPDNKILIAGSKQNIGGVFRFNQNGSLDLTFGNNGFTISNHSVFGADVSYHSNDKIILFGYSYIGSNYRDFSAVVFDIYGNLDNGFGNNGISSIDLGSQTQDYGWRGAIQPDGNLVITGQFDSSEEFATCRIIGPSISLGTDEFSDQNDLFIYPNPSNSFIQITGLQKEVKYTIYNLTGMQVSKGKLFNNQRINILNLVSGLYLLKLDNGNSVKFIKK